MSSEKLVLLPLDQQITFPPRTDAPNPRSTITVTNFVGQRWVAPTKQFNDWNHCFRLVHTVERGNTEPNWSMLPHFSKSPPLTGMYPVLWNNVTVWARNLGHLQQFYATIRAWTNAEENFSNFIPKLMKETTSSKFYLALHGPAQQHSYNPKSGGSERMALFSLALGDAS